jgi:hypothetical protein
LSKLAASFQIAPGVERGRVSGSTFEGAPMGAGATVAPCWSGWGRCSQRLRSVRRRRGSVRPARQSEVFAQGLALVFAPEQASPLQFGNNLVDEIVEALRRIWKHDIEAVATTFKKPLFHSIGDDRRRSDECQPPQTASDLGDAPHGKIVAPR